MITRPPSGLDIPRIWRRVYEGLENKAEMSKILRYMSPVDEKGRYLPFDEFRHRVTPPLSVDLAWASVKESRRSARNVLGLKGCLEGSSYFSTSLLQKTKTL